MDDEEYERLKAQYGAPAPAPADPGGMPDEEYEAAKAKFGAPTGAEPVPVATPDPEPVEATAAENVRHAAGGLAQGAFDTADLPYYAAQGINAVESIIPPKVAKFARDVAPTTVGAIDLFQARSDTGAGQTSELPGLKQAKEVLAKEMPGASRTAEAFRTAGEWGVGGVPKLFTKALTKIPKAIAPDVLSGAGAAGGQAAGEYINPEIGGEVGELVGGLGGILVALKTGNLSGLSRNEQTMLDAITDSFGNREEAIAEIQKRVDAGEKGTLTDLSRDAGVADIEEFVSRAPSGRRKLSVPLEQRAQQIYDDTMDPLSAPDADPTTAPWRAEQAVERDVRREAIKAEELKRTLEADTTTQVDALTARSRQAEAEAAAALEDSLVAKGDYAGARAAADPGRTTVEASESLTDNLNRGKAKYELEIEKPAWAEFDSGPKVDVTPMRQGMNKYLLTLTPRAREELADKFPAIKDTVSEWSSNMAPTDVTDVIQDFKDAINSAAVKGESSRHTKRLGELVDIMEGELVRTHPQYRDAVAATKGKYDRFGKRPGTAIKGDEPETSIQSLGTQGDTGAATVRQVNETEMPEAARDLYDYILAEAVRKGDNITPEFLASYQGAVDRMPEADRNKLQALIDAKGNADTALKKAIAAEQAAERTGKEVGRKTTALTRALEQEKERVGRGAERIETGIRGDVRGRFAEKPNATVDALLADPDGAGELKQLMDEMDTLNEVDSFKALVRDRLDERLFKGPTSIEAKANAYNDFVKMRDRLVEGDVLTQADAKRMTDALERTETAGLRKAARAADVTKQLDEHIQLMSSGGAAASLGWMPGGYSLMLGGAVRRSLKTLLGTKVTVKRMKILEDYLADPKIYLEGLEKSKDTDAATKTLLTRLVGAGQAAELLAGED